MPLQHSKSKGAFKANVKTLMGEIGSSPHVKDRSQALAVAYSIKRRAKRAMGGTSFPTPKIPSANPSFAMRQEAREMVHTGPIMSSVPGRTDMHNMSVPSGSYVVPAQAVSHLGQSNTMAGMKVLSNMFGPAGPYGAGSMQVRHGAGVPRPPKLMNSDKGGARGDDGGGGPVPVVTAGGEYVIEPHVIANIGGGDLKLGHQILDRWIVSIQKDHAKTIKKLPPPAKS